MWFRVHGGRSSSSITFLFVLDVASSSVEYFPSITGSSFRSSSLPGPLTYFGPDFQAGRRFICALQ